MKNSLQDLNNLLFEQLERVNDDDLTKEELDKQIKKSTTIAKLSTVIVQNAKLSLDAAKFFEENGIEYSVKTQGLNLLGAKEDE